MPFLKIVCCSNSHKTDPFSPSSEIHSKHKAIDRTVPQIRVDTGTSVLLAQLKMLQFQLQYLVWYS